MITVVDLEWIDSEIIQIGAIKYDSSFVEVSRLYYIIAPKKPSRIHEKQLEFMHLSKSRVIDGVSFGFAISRFMNQLSCKKDDVIIIWGNKAFIILTSLMDKYRKDKSVVIDIQKKYMKIYEKCSFKDICEVCGAEITKPFHNSENDCEYLIQAYKYFADNRLDSVIEKMEADKAHEMQTNRCRIVALNGSKVFHIKDDCRFTKGKSAYNMTWFDNCIDAEMLGLKPCKYCKPTDKHVKYRIYKNQPEAQPSVSKWNFDEIKALCIRYGMRCEIFSKLIFVYTDKASWYFKISSGRIILHHENLFSGHQKSHKMTNNYHVQRGVFNSPEEVIQYIYNHDKYKYGSWHGKCEI